MNLIVCLEVVMWKSRLFEWEARFNCDFGTGVVVGPFCSSLCCLSETGRFFVVLNACMAPLYVRVKT